MNHWLRLALPLGLGLAAAVVNWVTVSSGMKPMAFVRVNRSLARGAVFTAQCLERVEMSGELGKLPYTAVRWEDRATLYERPTPRQLLAGDLVLWRDATPLPRELQTQPGEVMMGISLAGMTSVPEFIQVGQQVGFFVGGEGKPAAPVAADGSQSPPSRTPLEYLGPFRVLAVGKRITPGGEVLDGERNSMETILTVAARFLPNSRRLDERSARLLSARTGFSGERILGIVLHRDGKNDLQRVAKR